VVVAVALVRMMEVAVDEEVDVVAVGDGLVAASRAVLVPTVMPAAGVIGRAIGRIRAADLDHVLVDVVAVRMVEVAVVEVVEVVAVCHRRMPAVRAVRMVVTFVNLVRLHEPHPSPSITPPPYSRRSNGPSTRT
jgi:hypothetical protein